MKEVVLDSNIFIRFLIEDVPSHFEQAKEIFQDIEKGETRGVVSLLVINEVIWILENFYELNRNVYIPQVLALLALENVKTLEAKKDMVLSLLEEMPQHSFDFTDVYLFAIKKGRKIVSFDRDFKKLQKRIEGVDKSFWGVVPFK